MHEEVSKEITDKSVHIAVRLAKPVLEDFMKALKEVAKKPVKAAGHAIGQKIHPTEGKQSVKTLIRQGQGVSSIPLADEGLKDFQKIAKKYGVDFAVVKDKNSEPPIYTIFFKAMDWKMPQQIHHPEPDSELFVMHSLRQPVSMPLPDLSQPVPE